MPSDDGSITISTEPASSDQLTQVAKDIKAHIDATADKLRTELREGMAFASQTAVEDTVKGVLDTRERAAAGTPAVQATGGSSDTNAIAVSPSNGIEANDDEGTTEGMTGVHQHQAEHCITATLHYEHDGAHLGQSSYSVPLPKACKLRLLRDCLSKAAADDLLVASRSGYSVSGVEKIVVAGGGPMSWDTELTKQKYFEEVRDWEQGGHQGAFRVDLQVKMTRNA